MVSVNALTAEGCWFDPRSCNTIDIKLVFAAVPLSTQHSEVRSTLEVRHMTGQSTVKIMCPG